MAVKAFSVRQGGAALLSQDFRVREFACKDGNDTVLVDLDLVTILQKIRDHFKAPVTINSAYRTASHNRAIGGATKSKHLEGRAADIVVGSVDPLKVCQYAESIGAKGVGRYNAFTHIDTRTSKYFWDCRSGTEKDVSSFGGAAYPAPVKNLKKGSKGNDVKWLQDRLNQYGHKLSVDGDFGPKTNDAVRAFQKAKKLVVDGIVGPKTRGALS